MIQILPFSLHRNPLSLHHQTAHTLSFILKKDELSRFFHSPVERCFFLAENYEITFVDIDLACSNATYELNISRLGEPYDLAKPLYINA